MDTTRTEVRSQNVGGVGTRRVTVGDGQGSADEFSVAGAGTVRLVFQAYVLGICEGNLRAMAHDGS